ncbi:putative protein kinase A anchor protein, nuclear localization signal [Rosa chinensis]|uniref:K Homology domain-containing protein n=2 Tax=Rosa chinensis TaxID=74649 RepID=A0A2P6RX37_ROSCH|nr:activating signal cointegrator 1 complex subunit 1 isoform X1 [Rosa chinensis]PRQ51000.1 putative protein kinase A anchor protein, nuclear localization signal [Rosa chinensis]
MIASSCRVLFNFRVGRVLKFTCTYVALKPLNHHLPLLGHCDYRVLSYSVNMDGRRHKRSGVDHNNKLNLVWRPVSKLSTQVSSNEECSVVEVTDKLEEEVHSCSSTKISSAQDDIEMASAVTEATKLTTCSSASQDNEEDKGLEGETVLLTEKHSISVEVGASLHRFIRGKGGSTQKMIEDETGVKIKIPLSNKKDSIIIEGLSSESVSRASEKMQAIIDEAVKSPSLDYSHFISLPLAIHPELVDKLVNFQNSILGITDSSQGENLDGGSNEDDSNNEDEDQKLKKGSDVAVELKAEPSKSPTLSDLGIEKSIFIKPKTFHLTVLMLKLWNKDRVHAATEVLQSISSEVMEALDNRALSIRLKGLNCMRGSFAKAGVLYAPVEEIGNEGRLMRACQVIIDAFVKAGLVLEKDANQKLKLHATVMKARHGQRNQKRKFSTFDARGIYKQYGSEEWGEYLIREAHLSQRFVYDDKGYYHCCASIPFPEICK